MGIAIVGIVTMMFLARYIVRRRRARLSRKEQYMSPSGLRWLRAHIPIVLMGAMLLAAATGRLVEM